MINLWLFSLLALCLMEGIAFYIKKYLPKKFSIVLLQQFSIWLAALILLCIFLIFERNISYVYVATCLLLTGASCQAITTYIAQEKQWSKLKYWLGLSIHSSLIFLFIRLGELFEVYVNNLRSPEIFPKLSFESWLNSFPLNASRHVIEVFSVTAFVYSLFYLIAILAIKKTHKLKCLWCWGSALAISLCAALSALPFHNLGYLLRHYVGI